MEEDASCRPASPEDASALARLIDMAGEGLPSWLWAQAARPGQTAMDVGVERARRDSGGFSWRRATVLTRDDAVLALLLDYELDDPYELPDLSAVPEPVRPLLELESLSPGAWYINAVATHPQWRRHGFGRRLLAEAEAHAHAARAPLLALIVAEENQAAVRLYRRLGYSERARRAITPWPGCPHSGDYLLMVRPVGQRGSASDPTSHASSA